MTHKMKNPKGRGSAEQACRINLTEAVRRRDFDRVREVFEQYGNYLLLVDRSAAGNPRVYAR